MKILVFILFFFCVDIHPEERICTIVVLCQKKGPVSKKGPMSKRDLCEKNVLMSKSTHMPKKCHYATKVPICHKSAHMSQK